MLDTNLLNELRAAGHRRSYEVGTALFVEGDDGARVFVIERGRVKISATTDDGHDVVLAIRGPGELLGELSALDGAARSATGTALEPVDATVVAPSAYRACLLSHPAMMMAHLVAVISHLRDANAKRVELSAYDIDRRVACRLTELAEHYGEASERGVRITVPLSQEELGAYTGASREGVARALQQLRRREIVETARRCYLILDLGALHKVANGRI